MAWMYFHLNERGTVLDDPEGRDVPDLATARVLAINAAREMMCADLLTGRLCFDCHIDVIAEGGERLLTVPFSEAVRLAA